jgi:hypothetical protein
VLYAFKLNKMKKHPIEKGRWIFEKLGMLPYNLVENHKNKIVRKLGLLAVLVWLPIVVTPFIPYLLYNMIEVLLHDA